MLNFSLSIPTKILFGPDKADDFINSIKHLGKKCLLLVGTDSANKYGYSDILTAMLSDAGIKVIHCGGVKTNPDSQVIYSASMVAKNNQVDFVLALGGASVIDAAKSVAILYGMSEDDITTFGAGQQRAGKIRDLTPVVAVPTVAGSGSEVSRFAMVSNYEKRTKTTITSDKLKPYSCWINPTFSITSKESVIREGFSCIFSNILDSYISDTDTDTLITDSYCELVVSSIFNTLPKIIDNSNEYKYRADFSLASIMSVCDMQLIGRNLNSPMVIREISNNICGFYPEVSYGKVCQAIIPAYVSWLSKSDSFENRIKKLLLSVLNVKEEKDKAIESGDIINLYSEYLKENNLSIKLSDLGVDKGSFPSIATEIVTCTELVIGERSHKTVIKDEDIIEILEIADSNNN